MEKVASQVESGLGASLGIGEDRNNGVGKSRGTMRSSERSWEPAQSTGLLQGHSVPPSPAWHTASGSGDVSAGLACEGYRLSAQGCAALNAAINACRVMCWCSGCRMMCDVNTSHPACTVRADLCWCFH